MTNDFSSDDLPNGLFPIALNHRSLREDYDEVLAYLKEHAPSFHSQRGKTNPYTGASIRTQRDYDEYLRQHALRLVYEKTFVESEYGELYLASKAAFDEQLARINAERSRRADADHVNEQEIQQLQDSVHRASGKLFRRTAAIVLLIAVLLIGCFKTLPDARRTAYSKGERAGYDSGYSVGFDSGKTVGYDSGKSDGYKEGHAAGKKEGYSSGVAAGRAQASAGLPSLSSSPSRSQLPPLNVPDSLTVYVSRKGKYHQTSTCSNMMYYTEMTLAEAIEKGYDRCSKCW